MRATVRMLAAATAALTLAFMLVNVATPSPRTQAGNAPAASEAHPPTCPSEDPTAGTSTGHLRVIRCQPAASDGWHPSSIHEHGDAPPQWVSDWSKAQFGHGLVFGGDEATPNENLLKHQAYKGYAFSKGRVQWYVRVHEASNPLDRSARWHSFEVYALDSSGGVSFWQGWRDLGDPATRRFPSNHPDAEPDDPEQDDFAQGGWVKVVSRESISMPCETWYSHGAEWQPDLGEMICNITSYYHPEEGTTAGDLSTWDLAGGAGTQRFIVLYWHGPDSTRYPTRNELDPRGWFCADTKGQITQFNVSGPQDCAEGSLPQHIAPTLPTVQDKTNWVSRAYESDGIALPN